MLWALITGGVGALAVGAALLTVGYRAGADSATAACQHTELQIERAATAGAAKSAAAAASAVQSAVSGIRIVQRTIRQEVEREIVEKPVYRDCRHAPEVLDRINSALSGSPVSAPSHTEGSQREGLVPAQSRD